MTDNQLFTLIFSTVNAGLIAQSITGVEVAKAFQPISVGVANNRQVACYKIGDHRYGFPNVKSVWQPLIPQMTRTTTQSYETTFQMSALIPLVPGASMTASDLINIVSAIMQDDSTVANFESQGIGILRVTDVRNPYFLDDYDRNEAAPSFDFTLTHDQVFTVVVPVIQFVDYKIYRV